MQTLLEKLCQLEWTPARHKHLYSTTNLPKDLFPFPIHKGDSLEIYKWNADIASAQYRIIYSMCRDDFTFSQNSSYRLIYICNIKSYNTYIHIDLALDDLDKLWYTIN